MSERKPKAPRGRKRTQPEADSAIFPDVESQSAAPSDEWMKLELEFLNHRWINGTSQRRAGMAFFTAAQGALLGLIGQELPHLTAKGFALGVFGILITALAWNNERRIGAYMSGYMRRMLEIELLVGIKMTTYGRNATDRQRTFSNRRMFALYFLLILIAWLTLLLYNLFLRIMVMQ